MFEVPKTPRGMQLRLQTSWLRSGVEVELPLLESSKTPCATMISRTLGIIMVYVYIYIHTYKDR